MGTQPSRLILALFCLASVICYYVILLLCGILLYHKHGDSDAVTVSLW